MLDNTKNGRYIYLQDLGDNPDSISIDELGKVLEEEIRKTLPDPVLPIPPYTLYIRPKVDSNYLVTVHLPLAKETEDDYEIQYQGPRTPKWVRNALLEISAQIYRSLIPMLGATSSIEYLKHSDQVSLSFHRSKQGLFYLDGLLFSNELPWDVIKSKINLMRFDLGAISDVLGAGEDASLKLDRMNIMTYQSSIRVLPAIKVVCLYDMSPVAEMLLNLFKGESLVWNEPYEFFVVLGIPWPNNTRGTVVVSNGAHPVPTPPVKRSSARAKVTKKSKAKSKKPSSQPPAVEKES